MNRIYLDTEFIFVQKDKCSFLQVSTYQTKSNIICDYRLNPNLNRWEKKYINNAINGKYGEDTKKVFEQVEKLIYNKEQTTYQIKDNNYKLLNVSLDKLKRLISNQSYYVWDKSCDKILFDGVDANIYDLQELWIKKFGGLQLGLIKAYKTTLYNLGKKDEKNLILNAHLAHIDVIILSEVDKFINTFNGTLNDIPIHVDDLEKKILKNNELTNLTISKINELNSNEEKNEEDLKKLKKLNKKLKKIEIEKEKLLEMDTYKEQWW